MRVWAGGVFYGTGAGAGSCARQHSQQHGQTCGPATVGALLPALQRQQLLQRVDGLLQGILGSVLCTKGNIKSGSGLFYKRAASAPFPSSGSTSSPP